MPDITSFTPFPAWSTSTVETAGADTANSTFVPVTGGAANVKGSYAQIIASTSKRAIAITVIAQNSSSGAPYAIDIATGGAGSEVVLIGNILLRIEDTLGDARTASFPVLIPAGTRIAARCQERDHTGATVAVGVALIEDDA